MGISPSGGFFARKQLPGGADCGIIRENGRFTPERNQKMKKRMIAALFCAGLLAFGPVSDVTSTFPGGGSLCA